MWWPWMGPMWGFWWIFPVIGLLLCLFFMLAMIRMMSGARGMCMGPHPNDGAEERRLRKEVEDLREQLKKHTITPAPSTQHGRGNAA